jgi:hypothetical protein
MSGNETELFVAFLKSSNSYVEFGAGGSTVAASRYVKTSILAVDSSAEWLDKVRDTCIDAPVKPALHFVDIGPIGEWGFPTDKTVEHKWPAYHEAIWAESESRGADLYMVDGRFRVACFAQAILHCRSDSIICFHDFASRPHYHRVHDLAREIVAVEDISFFVPKPGSIDAAKALLEEFHYDPR